MVSETSNFREVYNFDGISQKILVTNKNNLYSFKNQISRETATTILANILFPSATQDKAYFKKNVLTYLLEFTAIILIFLAIQILSPIKF